MMKSFLALIDILYVDHMAVTTPLFDQTLADYLGLPGARLLKGPALNPAQKVTYAFVMLREGFTIEVLGLAEDSPIERHVKHGGGPYHFCYAVGNIDASIALAESGGAKLLVKPTEDVAFDGRRVAFLFHDAHGVFELVESFPARSVGTAEAIRSKDMASPAPRRIPVELVDAATADTAVRLRKVFARVFPAVGETAIDTTAINVTDGWDSLAQLRLVMEVEKEFGIDIAPDEISKLTNFRSMLQKLERETQ